MRTDAIADWPIHPRPDWTNRFLAEHDISKTGICRMSHYAMGHTRIIISQDDGLWHLSISCVDRDPTWKEIATARYRLLPDVPEMAMYLPPLDEYVNLHRFTFHLHEVPRSTLIVPSA